MPTPDKAFILAAGMGTRLRPHTDTMPKPMVPVAGRPIIDYTLDKLAAIGVQEAVVNLHYLPHVLKNHLSGRTSPKITLSEEEILLNTGGGVKKCLNFFENAPFYMINGDALWENGPKDALLSLSEAFDARTSDLILLLQPVERMALTHGVGDYDVIGKDAVRNRKKQGRFMFTGIRIVHPRLFAYPQTTPEIFSFLALMDEAEKRGRLSYIIHEGDWHHISTPDDLAAVDRVFRSRA